MIKATLIAAAAAILAIGPASATDVTLKVDGALGKTKAQTAGGATSGSIAGGASIGNGVYLNGAANTSNAVGVVDARNGKNSSTVSQLYSTNSGSVSGGGSLGNAGGLSGATGQAESIGAGLAVKRTGSLSVKIK